MTTQTWDTDLMSRSTNAISSFTAEQRGELNELVWLVNNHQRNNESWAANIYADKFFELFGAWLGR